MTKKGFTLVEILVVIAIIAALIGLLYSAVMAAMGASSGESSPRYEQVWQSPFEDGRESCRLGIDPSANPYQGNRRRTGEAKEWLNGWQYEKQNPQPIVKQHGTNNLRLRDDS